MSFRGHGLAGVPSPRHLLISKVVAEVGEPGRLMIAGWIVSLQDWDVSHRVFRWFSLPLATYLATIYNVTSQNPSRGFLMVTGIWGSRSLSLCV